MTRFFVGQRVRKARGMCTGHTGTVVEIDYSDPRGLGVRADFGGVGCHGVEFNAGDVVWGIQDEHEPILPSGHQPSEYTFDKLMEELRSGVVA